MDTVRVSCSFMSVLVESTRGIYGLLNLYSTEEGRETRGGEYCSL
jgi:hypothetical protein